VAPGIRRAARFDRVLKTRTAAAAIIGSRRCGTAPGVSLLLLAGFERSAPSLRGSRATRHTISADVVVPPFLPDVGETRSELALYYGRISAWMITWAAFFPSSTGRGRRDGRSSCCLSANGGAFPSCEGDPLRTAASRPLHRATPGKGPARKRVPRPRQRGGHRAHDPRARRAHVAPVAPGKELSSGFSRIRSRPFASGSSRSTTGMTSRPGSAPSVRALQVHPQLLSRPAGHASLDEFAFRDLPGHAASQRSGTSSGQSDELFHQAPPGRRAVRHPGGSLREKNLAQAPELGPNSERAAGGSLQMAGGD